MLNIVTLQGRIANDIEMKQTNTGKSVIRFTIACDRNIKGSDGNKVTDFIRCIAWNKTAEFISLYFHKGNMLLLNGELQSRDWTDSEGKKRTDFEVNVLSTYFCSNKKGEQEEPESVGEASKLEPIDPEVDLPF